MSCCTKGETVKKIIFMVLVWIGFGCAYTPLAMEFSSDEPMLIGEAGGGKFNLSNLEGMECSGTYSLLSNSKHIQTDFECSDGRLGRAQVLRTGRSLTNGSGTGYLSDGTKVRILLGDMVHYRNAQGFWVKTTSE